MTADAEGKKAVIVLPGWDRAQFIPVTILKATPKQYKVQALSAGVLPRRRVHPGDVFLIPRKWIWLEA